MRHGAPLRVFLVGRVLEIGREGGQVTKYVFCTGGVVSSVGKGVTAASVGRILKARGIRSLVVTGVVTNGCVLMTAVDTMLHGYYPVVIRDCVGAYDLAWHESALEWMETQLPVFSSDEVIAAWQGQSTW